MAIPAELAYFFRQPILRDAAYQLQMPSDRARLHRLALEIMEAMFDGPPPEPERDRWGDPKCMPHPTDPVAADLAEHAARIREWAGDSDGKLVRRELIYLRRAAEHAESKFENDESVRLWERHANAVAAELPALASESLQRAGAVLGRSGNPEKAERLFERARSYAVDAGQLRAEGVVLGNLASLFQMTGRMEKAEKTYGLALAILREVGDEHAEGKVLSNLGLMYQAGGRAKEAELVYKRALATHRETGNRRFEGIALGNLASVYMDTKRWVEAERTYKEALQIHREVGNQRTEGVVMGNLATLYQITELSEKAEYTFKAALTIHRAVGNRRSEGTTLGNFAGQYRNTGRVEEAAALFAQAITIHRETRNRRGEGGHSCVYALCQLELNRANAREVWQNGAEILKEVGDKFLLEGQTKTMYEACAKAGVLPFDE